MDYHDLRQVASAVVTASVIYALYRRYNRPSVKDIPGPPNPSWVHGRLGDLVPLSIQLIAIQRTPVVLANSGCRCRRKAYPGGLWNRGPLEWPIRGIFGWDRESTGH